MKKKDWKNTLLMAKTDFSMKASLVTKEPKYRQQWLDRKIYIKGLELNKNNNLGSFILHDGPPYANGNLHLGHALNKILKDIIVRQKTMAGFFAPFEAGWDTHGLPIENKMLQELKMSKDDLQPLILRKKAAKYAIKQIENQKNQFKEMQLLTDFSKVYHTLDHSFEVGQLKLFKKMILDGLIYKGLKPIYWSPSSQSALAEAEVEYQDVRAPQIIVAMKVVEPVGPLNLNDELLIMTTTPWTLPANSAIAVGENFLYDKVKVQDRHFVIAHDLLEEVAKISDWENFEVVESFLGKEIIGNKYISTINKNISPVVKGHHVTTEAGTGLVHMAPLFGEDDFLIGKEHNLKMIMHVDDKGYLNENAGKYSKLFYETANKEIGLDLKAQNALISLKFFKHSYPHDWRTHEPIIFRGVPQWFVNIEKIKPQILKALNVVKSKPKWGNQRISKMMIDRNEWTISRQRTWGVPIIVFYDKNKNPIINEDIFNHVIELVSQKGTDIWWELSTDELLPKKYQGLEYTREMDIMDVWFDSGSSHMSIFPGDQKPPFDLYLEGSDQYRGWFNSSLINSVAFANQAPYKQIVSHGFVVDGKQQKMSKSKGNVVDPLKIIKQKGVDILRLWVANSDYTSDISISDEILKQVVEIYRRIRNTIRFMLGNLADFDHKNNVVNLENMHEFMAAKINNYSFKVKKHYESFDFSDVVKETNKFFIDLSGWYFDYAKDILYCDDQNNLERRSVQTNIFNILKVVFKAIAPILPTTIEEAYENIPHFTLKDSIFLERWNFADDLITYHKSHQAFYEEYRAKANKALEEARSKGVIKRSNEAILSVNIPAENRFFSEKDLAKALMVAKVEYGESFTARIFNDSSKCQRCWNHFEKSSLSKEELCHRCIEVVS